ncbi:MAG: ANTAR domain-containing protein [Clostridia bacterium]|nr:ANTAR domain-containing protein [Clostridia bacterium]
MERVVLAFAKDETADKIKKMLDGSGFEVYMICHSRAELLRSVAELDEILVIMGYKLPDGVADDVYYDLRDGQKLMSLIKAERQSEIYNQDIFVVTLPINRQILINAIETFIGIIERQKHRIKRTPEEKKIIDDAKAYLMENHMMTEEAAHRFIQKRSMDTGARFIDTARMILGI